MWPKNFPDRLLSWNQLRAQVQLLPQEQALEKINLWWFSTPWIPYYLHWDDIQDWPDPWQLLNDNYFCDVARGLGILYTISLLDPGVFTDAELILTNDDRNLVLVDKRKYILNWKKDIELNTNQGFEIKKSYSQIAVQKKYL